jgi:hypothetical protein
MAFISGDVRKSNAAFLLTVVPILVRLWYEAVVWRLEQGPQMLGFQVIHMAAGGSLAPVLGPLLLISFFALYVYLFWVAVLVLRRLIPGVRGKLFGVRLVGGCAILLVAFMAIADYLQQDELSKFSLLGGAFLLTACLFAAVALSYTGYRTGGRVDSAV